MSFELGDENRAVRERSEKVARQKLERIMGDQFFDYGIRAMGLVEVRQMLQEGKLRPGGEIYLPNHRVPDHRRRNPFSEAMSMGEDYRTSIEADAIRSSETEDRLIPFQKYLFFEDTKQANLMQMITILATAANRLDLIEAQKNSPRPEQYWSGQIMGQTSMGKYIALTQTYESLVKEVKKLAVSIDGLEGSERKRQTWEKVREYILSTHAGEVARVEAMCADVHAGRVSKDYDVLVAEYGEEAIKDVASLKQNPTLFEKPGTLARVLSLIYAVASQRKGSMNNLFEQYQVAAVVDVRAVSKASNGLTGMPWGFIHAKNGEQERLSGENILGLIALHGDSLLIKKLVELSSNAGSASAPVFTRRGTRKFPR